MEKETIFKLLKDIGLNEYESRAYATLVFIGPAKASEISQEAIIPQSKIYEVLDQLMNKQLVEVFNGRPKEYKAVAPEIAFKNILEQRKNEIQELEKKLIYLKSFLKPIRPIEEVTSGIWTIKGKKWQEFFNKTAEMIDRSKNYVYGVTRDFSLTPTLQKSVKNAIRRGVKIRVIGMERPNEISYPRVKWYKANGIEVRIFETKVHPRIVLIDDNEVLLRLDHDPTKRNRFGFNSIWSNDPSLVHVFNVYVKNLWEKAEKI